MNISTTVTNPGTALPFARSAMARANGWGAVLVGTELPILARLRDRVQGTGVSAVKPAYFPAVKQQTRLHVPQAPPELRL
ncbi:hypothetical protein GCM10027445_11110 [Amycolatopsis endophytica]|uniref:Uncharacterized protein n=1 Tax=Amycolatopsis endophytica TaxID=860233 RepID=A0A853AXJ7_9PSEU|nr:hypothetical protein [Amycolatopsis endophytica]NYI87344.1 hypothetical protein [Amycolatopsis endophytica]